MIGAGDVVAVLDPAGGECVYLLLGRVEHDGSRARWECLVLHREDDVWPRGKPGHVVWPTEDNLLRGEKLP